MDPYERAQAPQMAPPSATAVDAMYYKGVQYKKIKLVDVTSLLEESSPQVFGRESARTGSISKVLRPKPARRSRPDMRPP